MAFFAWCKWVCGAIFPPSVVQSPQTPMLQQQNSSTAQVPAPMALSSATPATPKGIPTMISQICGLIRTYEGWILPGGTDAAGNVYPNGSPSYQNNNEGNIRCEGPKEDWPSLAIGCSPGGFCIFKMAADGAMTLQNGITAIALGTVSADNPYAIAAKKFGLANCSQLTIAQFFVVRDPPEENQPNLYSNFVGKGLGVDSSTFRMYQLIQ